MSVPDPGCAGHTVGSNSEARAGRTPLALVQAIACGVIAIFVFVPAISHQFLNWDDDVLIVNNAAVSAPDGWRRIWSTIEMPEGFPNYPLVFTSYWLEHRLFGSHPAVYHGTNVVLHGLNTALVFGLVRMLGGTAWVAGCTALLFGVHPMQVESVAWVSERKNVLAACFSLLTCIGYFRFRAATSATWFVLTLISFACALLSKTATVVVPISLALADRFRDGRWTLRSAAGIAPMLLLATVAGFATVAVERQPLVVPFVDRPFLIATSLSFYVTKLLVPLHLIPIYPHWRTSWQEPTSWLTLVAIVITAAVALRSAPHWQQRWAVAHFVCALLPFSGLHSYGFNEYSFVADRHVYLASIGFFLFAAMLLDHARRAIGHTVTVVTAALLAGYVGLTLAQIRIWHDSVTLWSSVAAVNPEALIAHNNLGLALIERGQLEQAAVELEAVVAHAPADADAHTNLGLIAFRQGDVEGAETHCRQAVAVRPNVAEFHKNLAVVLQQRGALAEAADELRRAQGLRPNAVYAYMLGEILAQQARTAEALAEFQRALALDPGMEAARRALTELHTGAQ